MKLTSTQSSSAVSTPVIEHNEAVFSAQFQQLSQPSDQSNMLPIVVQPKLTQLSDLEQELVKIHQKRYNKDQSPMAPNVDQQLLSNNALIANATNAQITQIISTLPIINASQSSHIEPSSSVNTSVSTTSADSNENTLNVQSQQPARKISRFQVSVVNEATPAIQAQPQDSTNQTQFLQTTSLVASYNSTVDEKRSDYGSINFQNFPNTTAGNGEYILCLNCPNTRLNIAIS